MVVPDYSNTFGSFIFATSACYVCFIIEEEYATCVFYLVHNGKWHMQLIVYVTMYNITIHLYGQRVTDGLSSPLWVGGHDQADETFYNPPVWKVSTENYTMV